MRMLRIMLAAALVAGTAGLAAARDEAPDSQKMIEGIYGDAGPSGSTGGVLFALPFGGQETEEDESE